MIRLNSQAIDIPAGDARYVVHDTYTLPVDVDAYSVQPHAHYLARMIEGTATLPSGITQPLILIKDWDFHWQEVYRYRTPLFLPAGTRLEMEYTYDNSAGNRSNPNRPVRRVLYGQQATDEMGDLWIQVLPRHPTGLAILKGSLLRKLLPQNIQGYRMMLQADSLNRGLHDDLALLLWQFGDFAGAIEEFETSRHLAPESATAHYNLANALLGANRLGEAIPEFEQALSISPEYGLAQQGLGLALLSKGRMTEAEPYLTAAAGTLHSATAYYNLGVLRQRQGRLEASLAAYRQAVQLAPDYADAHYEIGIVDALLRNDADAISSFRTALVFRSPWPQAELALSWLLATTSDDAMRDVPTAVRLATRTVTGGLLQDPHALDVLATALAASGEFDRAVTLERAALELLISAADPATRHDIETRLRLFDAGRTYRTGAGAGR
jgi:tetratricopeptide (TPR) repeat protein